MIRFILIILVVFLAIRSFVLYEAEKRFRDYRREDEDKRDVKKKRKVPEDIGEYVDYEEVKD